MSSRSSIVILKRTKFARTYLSPRFSFLPLIGVFFLFNRYAFTNRQGWLVPLLQLPSNSGWLKGSSRLSFDAPFEIVPTRSITVGVCSQCVKNKNNKTFVRVQISVQSLRGQCIGVLLGLVLTFPVYCTGVVSVSSFWVSLSRTGISDFSCLGEG